MAAKSSLKAKKGLAPGFGLPSRSTRGNKRTPRPRNNPRASLPLTCSDLSSRASDPLTFYALGMAGALVAATEGVDVAAGVDGAELAGAEATEGPLAPPVRLPGC